MRKTPVPILVLMLGAAPAQAFVAENGLVVEPQSDGTVLVPWRGSSAATDFWCAAGDYAARVLGKSPGEDIWRLSAPPRRQGEGIAFAMSAPESPLAQSYFASETGRMSVSLARDYCEAIDFWPALDD
jgi:hypothetical protein